MKKYLMLAICIISGSAYSQEGAPDASVNGTTSEDLAQSQSNFPVDIADVRENQMLRGRNGDVRINFRDEGLTSLSLLIGVPTEFRTMEISNENALKSVIEGIYPYYGFTGSESLELKDKRQDSDTAFYTFTQKINDIPTKYEINVQVSNRDNHISGFVGTLRIDRGFASEHVLTEQEALVRVHDYLNLNGKTFDANEDASAVLYYDSWGEDGGIAPWWLIKMYGNPYFVDPKGEVDESSGITEVK